MSMMSLIVSKLLILTSAVLLALPPGWCCITPNQKTAETPPKVPHSCCQLHQEQPTPDQEPVPRQPVQKCCCEKELPSPQNPETAPLELTFTHSVAIPAALSNDVGGVDGPSFDSSPFSPPLHILQCVWRC